jgi:hypothetical protein
MPLFIDEANLADANALVDPKLLVNGYAPPQTNSNHRGARAATTAAV